jgi:hypothetical protein
MGTIFDELELDAATYSEAEEQTVRPAFEVLPSGAYKAEIKQLATFTTDSGAGMLYCKIYIPSEDRDIEIYQNTKKKDGTPNKIGTATFKHIIQAVNVDSNDLTTKKEEITAYGKKVQGTVVKGLSGKPFLALVRAVFEEGSKYENYNEVEAWARVDGTNSKSEDIKTVFLEKISKNPVLQRKAKQQSGGNASTKADVSGTSKDVEAML